VSIEGVKSVGEEVWAGMPFDSSASSIDLPRFTSSPGHLRGRVEIRSMDPVIRAGIEKVHQSDGTKVRISSIGT